MTENSSLSINIGTALVIFDNTVIGVARTPVEIVRSGQDPAFSDWNDQAATAWIQSSGTGLAVNFEIDVPANGVSPILDSSGKLTVPAPDSEPTATGRQLKLLPPTATAGRGLIFPSAVPQTAWRYVWSPAAPHRLKLGFRAFPDANRRLMTTTNETAAAHLSAPRAIAWTDLEKTLADELNSAVPLSQSGMWYSGTRSAARNGGAVRVVEETPDACGMGGSVVFILAIRQPDGEATANVAARLLAAMPWHNRAGFGFVAVQKAVRTENSGINVTLAATFSR